jgi:hypothetical protein
MNDSRKIDLCFVVSHGFAARMVLYSSVIQELQRRGFSIALFIPGGNNEHLIEVAEALGVHVAAIPAAPLKAERFSQWIRPYVFENVRSNPALWAKHLRAVNEHPVRGPFLWAFLQFSHLSRRIPFIRKALLAWLRSRLRAPEIAALLQGLRPRLVVSTYPVNDVEAATLLEAQMAGICTVGQLLSWDNITAKGRWLVVPDRFTAWGPIMAEELREHYGVQAENVVCTGVPHFDVHVSEVDSGRTEDAIAALGLNPQQPYLFFGMSSPVFAPTEIDVVEWLAQRIESDDFGPNMQLVVRPHPQNVLGNMADEHWLPRLAALTSDRVAVHYPRIIDGSLPWTTERTDLVELASLIGGCSACLNSGSTLTIDAVIRDRPVVLPLFDVNGEYPWWCSARRIGDYRHQRRMLDLGGATVTHNLESTKLAILRYLADPSRHAAGRELIRVRELGPCDGKASERVAAALASFAAAGCSKS